MITKIVFRRLPRSGRILATLFSSRNVVISSGFGNNKREALEDAALYAQAIKERY